MGLLKNLKLLLAPRVDIATRFELQREAISGTMSSFYMARDVTTHQIVGLKLLNAEKTAAFEARFKGLNKPSEGEIGRAIQHPYVVKTLDYGTARNGQEFIVLEYLQGSGLNTALTGRSPQFDGHRLALIRQAAEAIQAVHQAGYIHRDICPRNFVISQDMSSLKLIDFGLAVPATAMYMQPGNRTGTPNYMAPEIVPRRKTDQRVDLFAFGVTAFEICTFESPWPRGATGAAALYHDTHEPVEIRGSRPTINPRLARAIMSCLDSDPERRPKSIDEFFLMIHGVTSEDDPA